MAINSEIFRAYDVRGIYPLEIDEDAVYKIAQAYVKVFKPKGPVVLGKDVRLSSPSLWQAAAKGLTDAGIDVIDIGTISTDMLYFAVAKYGYAGGMTISASHNPKEYNGMKFVRAKAIAISGDTGIMDMRDQVLKNEQIMEPEKGEITKKEILTDYVKHCLSFIDPKVIKPMKIVGNANFGMAGVALNKILESLPVEIVPLDFEPNGNFPKGKPDPMIAERRQETEKLVKQEKADLGAAWDADADRIFLFDENGEYIDNYFLSAILDKILLGRNMEKDTPSLKLRSAGKVIYDPRQYWAVIDTIKAMGGVPIINKVGHAFIKDRLREENALCAGEITGHFYFRDNFFCDNGMIPLLLILEKLSVEGIKASELVKPFKNKYFFSPEISQPITADADKILAEVEKKYADGEILHIDGLSVEYSDWRFNLRKSNTEPLIRLNVEAKSQALVDEKVKELLKLIK